MSLLPVISLWNPYADLITLGLKVHETRHWQYPQRLEGERIAIHAAQRIDGDLHPLVEAAMRKHRGTDWRHTVTRGAVVCTGILGGCHPTELHQGETALDFAAGNWEPGRFAWRLNDVRRLREPFVTVGRQGWWSLEIQD